MAKRKQHWTEREWLKNTICLTRDEARLIEAGRMLRELARQGYDPDVNYSKMHRNWKALSLGSFPTQSATAKTWDAAVRKLVRAIRREEVGRG